MVAIERSRSTERIARDIDTLAGPDYTLSSEAIRRYAYTGVYRNTLDYFRRELEALGFTVSEDPVGTLVARNRPPGEKVFGVGSHCDSDRNGGKYDGTMGVVTALEVCRLNDELGYGLPLQLISVLEAQGSGYVHADVVVHGRGVHAGATPMDLRLDPTLVLAETIAELQRLAQAAGQGTVGTVGEIEVDPGIINAIAARVRFSLDIRGPVDEAYRGVAREIAAFAEEAASKRGMTAECKERQNLPATAMDERIVSALEASARETGEPYMR